MRIDKLDLIAFGPFRHARLDFGHNPEALQVVFGHNEAGKSTTLRAITQLFYGMPHQSPDAHRHEQSKLRVGATLLDEDGSRLRVIRRKGRVNTLLDPEGEPLDEALLVRLLGGTPRGLFERMFGLDHSSLREGAEALLSGGGDLGEGLFDAGVGGVPVHRVLKELRDEAEALYKPRGSTPQLNAALRQARELGERRRAAALPPEKWQEQKRALERAEQRHRELSEQRARLGAEQARLKRALSVLPRLRELDRHRAEREALGDVPRLDADATQRRLQAETGLRAAESELQQHQKEQGRLRERLEALGEPPAEPLGEQVTQQLREQFGGYRKAAQQLPELEVERRNVAATLSGLQAALPAGVLARLGEAYRPPADLEARLTKHAHQSQQAQGELSRRTREAAEREDEIADLRDTLAALGPARDVGELQALLSDPRAQTDVTSLREGQAELQAEVAQLSRSVAELGVAQPLEALASLPLPANEVLGSLRETGQTLTTERRRLNERQQAVDAELLAVRTQQDALTAHGEVPSEAALRSARQARDGVLAELEQAWSEGHTPPEGSLGELRSLLTQADSLADRLWREADRVQRAAELRARRERALSEGDALREAIDTWEKEHGAWRAELRAELEPLGLAGLDVREAERRVAALRQLQRELDRVQRQQAGLAQREREARALAKELAQALDGADEEGQAADLGGLGRGLALARQQVQREGERSAQAQAKQEAIRNAERARARAGQRRDQAEQTLREQAARWQEEAVQLGLGEDASEDEVLSCVRVLRERAELRDALAGLEARIDALRAEMHAHEEQVSALCREHLDGLEPASVAEGVDSLDRHCQAERDRARDRAHLQEALEKHAELERQARARHGECERALAALCERAGVQDPGQLPEAEERSAQALRLEQRVGELQSQLREAGDGEDIEALRALADGVVPEQARARLADLEDELEGLREELDAAKQEVGRTQGGLERYEEGVGAAELAEAQESQLAEVLELSHQYLVRRLSERILRGEVERYREANQGPLLKRASELVGPLTSGRYVRLTVDFEQEDRPRLHMVRADGQAVAVDAMSDGTRDMLYLALRLSSLERFVAHNTPVPLVLDDCFIHFDDARARAALGVLGGYAKTTQVLLFTHHQRIVELAREALGKSGVVTHDLDEARRLGEGRNDGPLFASH